MKTKKKNRNNLILEKCDIESCNEKHDLHLHHIQERHQEHTTNNPMNLVVLCPNHHYACHSGRLKIIGIFPSTQPPNNRTVVYELDGKRNIEGIDFPYFKFKNKSYSI